MELIIFLSTVVGVLSLVLIIGMAIFRFIIVFTYKWHKRVFHKCGYSTENIMWDICPSCGEKTDFGDKDCVTRVAYHKYFGGYLFKEEDK